jgi:hypothetical protein
MADPYDEQGLMLPVEDWPLVWRTGLIVGIDTEELACVLVEIARNLAGWGVRAAPGLERASVAVALACTISGHCGH